MVDAIDIRQRIVVCGKNVDIPKYEDIQLSNYLGFQDYAEQFGEAVSELTDIEDMPDDPKKFDKLYVKMYKLKSLAIAEFFGVSAKDLKVKNTNTNTIAANDVIDLVFDMIVGILGQYSPRVFDGGEPFVFEHKGERYTIANEVGDLTMEELVESLEVERGLSGFRAIHAKKDREDLPNDTKAKKNVAKASNADIFYTEAVNILALLARKDGEELPYSDGEVERLRDKRRELFADIHFSVGIDIVFFFAGITSV